MNVLAIGNSFSQDAFKYLNNVARCSGDSLTTVNLYIGGCSLSKHYKNMLADAKDYIMEFNGSLTGFKVSLKEALLNREWDYISLQQSSNFSPYFESYQPYLDELAAYVRKHAPKAKIVIHQTWAYEQGSARLCDELGKDGGFILSEGKMLSYRNDAKRENYKAVCDFVANYRL